MPNCDCGTCCEDCGHLPGCMSLQPRPRMDDADQAAAAAEVWLPRQRNRRAA